ncbi:hypothetical protein REL07_018310 [Clostridioides difficile]|uniref:hypothetical protein n=1 Tax=Clostridioides difficile TaxID=1496 RepID=UPI001C151422|nr:hypothetical protein [Clostridioides difficile]MBY2164455.1 hypothetical protein [Clostridioides difficile]MBY2660319.1 hypothetical protein [Clostridioides difficile]MBZ0664355.1 hypothetical protein [Clostridioides difficile]MBZ1136172.1 hypothetical protein [Clostridioides difficile]
MLNEDVVKNINKLNNEKDNINLELSKKANKEHKHNVSDIEGLTIVANAEDINYTNIKNEEISNSKQALDVLFTDTETSKKSILDIENLVEAENIKYTTDTGEYTIENSKKGYITNLNIEGKTLVNLASTNMFKLEGRSTKEDDFIKLNDSAAYVDLTSILNTGIYTLFINTSNQDVAYTLHSILSDNTNNEVFTKAGSQIIQLNMKADVAKLRIYTQSTTLLNFQMILLEGDYTSKNISYFEGLQSAGQGDNIELLSYKNDGNLFDGEFRNGSYIDDGSFYADNNATSNKNFISVVGEIKEYECYKYDKKIIPYTLRSLPNGVKDEIVYKNNKYYLIKRCEEIILDGDNFNPRTLEEQNNNIVLYVRTDPVPDAKPLEGVLGRINTICCDRFKSVDTTWGNEITTEGIIIDQNRTISFRILRSKLETQDIEGAKKWVKYNRIKVVYELETPREIELASLNLEQYDNQTRFICNTSAITPDISFESTQNLGSHIEVIRENLKNSNIRTDFPFSINFLNGWQPYLGSASSVSNYCTNNNFVTINAVINGGITTAGTIIGKIPSEYAPRKATIVIFQTTDGKYYNGIIRTNGKIEIYYNDITYSSWLYLYVNYLI